ncbi:hypothetical protein ABBQ38_009994 [Trebouxia sp. C0009 RCD-2024]
MSCTPTSWSRASCPPMKSLVSTAPCMGRPLVAFNPVQRSLATRCCCRDSDNIDARVQSGDTASSSGRSSHDAKTGVCNRRSMQLAIVAAAAVSVAPCPPATALTLQDVTPQVVPAGALSAREEAIIDIFERNTNSVANVFDITLQGGARRSGTVDTPEGNGTGFVWDSEGHVITNFHVLASALRQLRPAQLQGEGSPRVAKLTLFNKQGYQQSYDAALVGADRSKDIVVLRLLNLQEALQPMQLGESGKVRIGQQVLAIGNPFGFDHTLTTGVVSGIGREIQSQAGAVIGGGIQTDAAINPGNSGGPLLDSQGRVIGVNTAIFTNTGTSAGVGFAIPIDIVRSIVPQLIQYGKVVRPALNIQLSTDQVARALRVSSGALVQSVGPNSAAVKAGLLPTRRGLTGIITGDVITGINDRKVTKGADLALALDSFQVGDRVTLKVRRGEEGAQGTQDLTLSLTLEEGSSS